MRLRSGDDEAVGVTPQERVFWQRAQRRARGFQPEIAAAILLAFQVIRDSLDAGAVSDLSTGENMDRLLTEAFADELLARAFFPFRQRIRSAVERHVTYFARQLPKGGRIDGVLAISFDYLNPRVIDAVRALESKVMTTLQGDIRETVRAYVENGIRKGLGPRAIATPLRSVIGLAPNQETAVRNFERALRGEPGAANPLGYKLRDRRFDGTVKKGGLTDAQVTTQVAAYRKKMVAFNATTNARTATLDAMKLGQHLAWQDAIDRGIVDRYRLKKKWIGVMDSRERPEHVEMEGETVPFLDEYSNGEVIPGESTYNCRCIARYFQTHG